MRRYRDPRLGVSQGARGPSGCDLFRARRQRTQVLKLPSGVRGNNHVQPFGGSVDDNKLMKSPVACHEAVLVLRLRHGVAQLMDVARSEQVTDPPETGVYLRGLAIVGLMPLLIVRPAANDTNVFVSMCTMSEPTSRTVIRGPYLETHAHAADSVRCGHPLLPRVVIANQMGGRRETSSATLPA
jgi:hypothetical protein